MRALPVVLIGSTFLTACGGSGSSSEPPVVVQPEPIVVPPPRTAPVYDALRIREADDSGLRAASNAQEFEDYLKNGLRLLLRDGSAGGDAIYTLAGAPEAGALDSAASGESSRSSDFSGTNVQVEGVDEGDLVKYDGEYLYIYTPRQWDWETEETTAPGLRIVRTFPDQANVEAVGEFTFADEERDVTEMYLAGNAVAALSQTYEFYARPAVEPATDLIAGTSYYAPQKVSTRIELIDTSNVAEPDLSWTMEFDGSMQASRKIGNMLYLVSRHSPFVDTLLYEASTDEEKISNEDLIEELPVEDLLPSYTIDGGEPQPLVAAEDCLVPGDLDENEGFLEIVTVAAIDLDSRSLSSSLCMSTPVNGVYSSIDNMYIGATIYDNDYIFFEDIATTSVDAEYPQDYTAFHKIALNDGAVGYRASGEVTGTLGWQAPHFRMDEHNGDLRVVTTRRNNWQPVHQLTILREDDEQTLDTVAELPNEERLDAIGKPGEEIYAVRFYGDNAFIVTFEQIDPLYKLDLSNPADPSIAGELEIPGYSSYLHPINGNWMLAVGHDVVDRRNGGIKVELFDISADDPRSAGNFIIGEAGSWSEAIYDHRALTFLAGNEGDRLQMAFPINVADTPSAWDPAYFEWSHTGLYLFSVDGLSGSDASLSSDGAIISGERSKDQSYPEGYGSRGVMHDDSVFFVYDGDVWSSFWDNPESAVSTR